MKDQHDTDIKMLEQQLADLSPSPLTSDLLTRMEQAMESWETHLPIEEKIVPFETHRVALSSRNKLSNFTKWSAAAAVALMAGVGAVFMTDSSDTSHSSSNFTAENSVETITPSTEVTALAPHFSHELTNASNEGITYSEDNTPYKVYRIEYIKEVPYVDENGVSQVKKEPATEVLLLPIDVQ